MAHPDAMQGHLRLKTGVVFEVKMTIAFAFRGTESPEVPTLFQYIEPFPSAIGIQSALLQAAIRQECPPIRNVLEIGLCKLVLCIDEGLALLLKMGKTEFKSLHEPWFRRFDQKALRVQYRDQER